MFKCVHCKKHSAVKAGLRKNNSGFVQRYFCTECKKYSVNRKGLENYRHNVEVISAALDLRAKGLSLADVVDHLDQHHRVKVSRKTILDWQNKFGKKLSSFSQTLTPHLEGTYHADEMFYKAAKKWHYYWDCIDYETKFLLADHVSDDRNNCEAIDFLKKIKNACEQMPKVVHTDCSYDYPPAFRAVFPRRRIHKPYPAWRHKFKNNPIERYHNTLKQRYKTFRGFNSMKTSEEFFEFFKTYYNFIRKHTSLAGLTPAQAAKIELALGRNRLRSLIELLQLIAKAMFEPHSKNTLLIS